MYKLKNAFTLAEVLLTLTVIGIVAAMTIPSLLNSTSNLEQRTAFKKSFATLNQATRLMAVDNGGNLVGLFTSKDATRDAYKKYLGFTKTCNANTPMGKCWYVVKFLNGTPDPDPKTHWSQAVTSDGMTMLFDHRDFSDKSSTCNLQIPGMPDNVCHVFVVDINGAKGPNTYGKDVYTMTALKNGTVFPTGYNADIVSIDPTLDDIPNDCDKSNSDAKGNNCGWLYLRQ